MTREEVSEEKLVQIINGELKKYEECAECHVNGVMSLVKPDAEGCNWSEPFVTCSGTPGEVCQPVAARIISDLRGRYNLK